MFTGAHPVHCLSPGKGYLLPTWVTHQEEYRQSGKRKQHLQQETRLELNVELSLCVYVS